MTEPESKNNRKSSPAGGPLPADKAGSSIGFLLSQVGIYAAKRFAERISAIELHPPEFRVMNVVDAAEGLSQQAIGEAIQAPASRMVAIVDELEGRGLVERRPARATGACVRST